MSLEEDYDIIIIENEGRKKMMNKLDEKYLKIMELALKLNPDPTNRLSTGYKPTIEVSYDGARAYLFVVVGDMERKIKNLISSMKLVSLILLVVLKMMLTVV